MAGDQETAAAAAAVTAGGELVPQISWITASQDFAGPWRVHALLPRYVQRVLPAMPGTVTARDFRCGKVRPLGRAGTLACRPWSLANGHRVAGVSR
jgi:hypothetical protein